MRRRLHGLLLYPSVLPLLRTYHRVLRHRSMLFLLVVVEPLDQKPKERAPFFFVESRRKFLNPLYPVHEVVTAARRTPALDTYPLYAVVPLQQTVVFVAVGLGIRRRLRRRGVDVVADAVARRYTVLHFERSTWLPLATNPLRKSRTVPTCAFLFSSSMKA
ncbi:unnamed protein product [Ixodes persulcatus]